jgi:histidine ammonia-lyase
MNIQLLKAADFNIKLYQRGCPKTVSVQKICKVAKDEKQVREILEDIWKNPKKSEYALAAIVEDNKEVYDFEKLLEQV